MASRAERPVTWWRDALDFSPHAIARMQQRGVPRWVVEALIAHGAVRHVGNGDVSYSFTRRSWERMRAGDPELGRAIERWRNTYVVLSAEGTVKTVARRRSGPDHAGPHRPRPEPR